MGSEGVKEAGMGESRVWPSAEGLAVGLALPGAHLQARKSMEEDGDVGEDVHALEVRN